MVRASLERMVALSEVFGACHREPVPATLTNSRPSLEGGIQGIIYMYMLFQAKPRLGRAVEYRTRDISIWEHAGGLWSLIGRRIAFLGRSRPLASR